MASKKVKRQLMQEKRERFMNELQQSGLTAQTKDREMRARKERDAWRDQHDKKHSWKKRIKECPLCGDELRAAARASSRERVS